VLLAISRELDRYPEMDSNERHFFLRDIQKHAVIDIQQTQPATSACPYTKEPLALPCSLNGCPFWVNHSWTKNCSLNFLVDQAKDSLSVSQVSFLYKKSPERIQSIYKNCFKIVQRHYLKNYLKTKNVPRFHYIPGFCVTCQSKLLEEEILDSSLRLDGEHGYCSTDCKKQFPAAYFEIEKFFEADFFRVVEIGGEIFNFYYLEEVLGFQPNVLRNRLEKIRDGKKDRKKVKR
jgi:hypothetical protein